MPERRFLTAHWRNLLMLNYAVDPELLAPYVPNGTVLDAHGATTYVSLVAFQFEDTRVLGLPVPLHRNFEELNLRFYVRREHQGEVRRAVVFIREVVPRRAIALVARVLYNEPYVALPMRHRTGSDPPRAEYGWKLQGVWHSVAADAEGPGALPAVGSVEEFITEHYWGYTRQRDGQTLEYRVEHPRWRVWPARLGHVSDRLELLYGAELANALATPRSVFIADGSPVTVFRGERLPSRAAPA